MKLVLFHGSFNSYDQLSKFWLPKLRSEIAALGVEIIFPKFPTDTWDEVTDRGETTRAVRQNLKTWMQEFDRYIPAVNKGDDLIFIGHSLGPLFILHLLERLNLKLDCAIFVSPFLTKLRNSPAQINTVNASFYKDDFSFLMLKKLWKASYVVYGENDPYVDLKQIQRFAKKTGSSAISVVEGGHLNKGENTELIIELCKSRLGKVNT